MDLRTRHGFRRIFADIASLPFFLAVVLLAGAAILAGPLADWLGAKHAKLALPLKSPLSAMDEGALAPYRVVQRHVFEPIIVEALGTENYLSWALENTSASAEDPLRYAHLLVTYDTGGHNLVPHTPDVCRLGAGYHPAQPHENMEIELPALQSRFGAIPVRVCTFAKTDVFNREQVSVVYTFFCNGEFVATRSGVRVLINDLTNTYAFFSKVEVSFPRATRAQCVEEARTLLDRVLPVLIAGHFPDFQAAEARARGHRDSAG